ncbi:MAG: hypothetical protein E7353_08250 [Clostridiales bacterium]|nr:hypothetical protein [Clostridiales bacterium]
MNEKIIQLVLLENKIKPNIKGYKYCFEILKIICLKGLRLNEVYLQVAKNFNIKANSVEKSVSNAIAKAFLEQDMQQRYEKLCWKTGKANNKEFIFLLKNQVLMHNVQA